MSWERQPGYCPSCKAVVAPDSKDCLACGCVFEKWNAKQARETLGDYQQKESRAQALFQPAYDVAPSPAEKSPLLKRLSGAGAGAAAVALLFWLYSPGKPAPAPQQAQEAGKAGFSFVAPAGWAVVSQDANCRDGGCVIAAFRADGPKDRVNANITLQLFERKTQDMAGAAREALEAELLASLQGGYDAAEAGAATELVVDGLPSLKIEGAGAKHLRLQTVAEVAMNAQAYLREQEAKNPGKGVYTVMAKQDYSRAHSNPFVVTQEAQYVEIDAKKVDGMILIPLSARFLRVSYEYDQADAATAQAALAEFLGGLRVRDRSRPVDRLGPMKPPAQFGALGLIFAAVFLLLT